MSTVGYFSSFSFYYFLKILLGDSDNGSKGEDKKVGFSFLERLSGKGMKRTKNNFFLTKPTIMIAWFIIDGEEHQIFSVYLWGGGGWEFLVSYFSPHRFGSCWSKSYTKKIIGSHWELSSTFYFLPWGFGSFLTKWTLRHWSRWVAEPIFSTQMGLAGQISTMRIYIYFWYYTWLSECYFSDCKAMHLGHFKLFSQTVNSLTKNCTKIELLSSNLLQFDPLIFFFLHLQPTWTSARNSRGLRIKSGWFVFQTLFFLYLPLLCLSCFLCLLLFLSLIANFVALGSHPKFKCTTSSNMRPTIQILMGDIQFLRIFRAVGALFQKLTEKWTKEPCCPLFNIVFFGLIHKSKEPMSNTEIQRIANE
ncbi:hypothetical protein VP01_272g3 [Puccinia sorghi]|uniref:Uncharacterized protein n=1 Tax=Puccinia sorghi TaxID=27349 RepID=A0A0L6V3B4_9BASI|nr:hypothetical protein VP01_272g3 [Puccinia sorghi]